MIDIWKEPSYADQFSDPAANSRRSHPDPRLHLSKFLADLTGGLKAATLRAPLVQAAGFTFTHRRTLRPKGNIVGGKKGAAQERTLNQEGESQYTSAEVSCAR